MARPVSALFFLIPIFIASVALAALPPADYWKAALPDVPMPGAVRALLQPADVLDGKGTAVSVGKGGVQVAAGKGRPGGTTVGVGHTGVGVNAPGTRVGVGHGGVGVSAPGTRVGVGHGGVGVHVRPRPGKPPTHVYVPPFIYNYAATETQLHDDPIVALFFLEKDLYPGGKMRLHFTRTAPAAAFIPRSAANAIPFSSEQLPQALRRLSVEPNSVGAQTMKKTLRECETPAAAGETKYCATSLESMVDFATLSLGSRRLRAVSTEVVSARDSSPEQQYTVAHAGVQKLTAGSKAVTCHAEAYPYAVFYCHATSAADAYAVALAGEDGGEVKAVAVCHKDTSSWNPRHLAFQVLKVKPGTLPVCHFLPQDHVVWALRY